MFRSRDRDCCEKKLSDKSVSCTDREWKEKDGLDVIYGSQEMKNNMFSFLPQHIQLAPPLGSSRTLQGCCMLADISGFTRLSSNLCSEGLSGIDKLRRITDKSFNQFVDIVYSYHGDVMAFAGDALICLFLPRSISKWRESRELCPLEWHECCARAVRCALKISQCRIEGVSTHVAVCAGTVSLSLLGGYNDKYTYIMNGDCVDELGECLDKAGAQELVVSGRVFDNLPQELSGFAVPSSPSIRHSTNVEKDNRFYRVLDKNPSVQNKGNTVLEAATLSLSDLDSHLFRMDTAEDRTWSSGSGSDTSSSSGFDKCGEHDILSCVSQPVVEAIATKTFAHLSELRTVTTMFVNMDTYSTAAFRNAARMQPYFLKMQKCLDDCGGLLRQFIVDDKGCVLIGLWGVPTASFPGSCCRAIRCAMMMASEAGQLGHSLSIGITTGRVYCGVVGTDYRRDYVAIGKSVNLSARLMAKAVGRILLDNATVQRLPLDISRHAVRVEDLVMKGIGVSDKYYCYSSSVGLPPIGSDVLSDKVVMIPKGVRVMASRAVDIVSRRLDASLENSAGWDQNIFSEDDEIIYRMFPADVILVKGKSGAGKTATLYHFVRRINDMLELRSITGQPNPGPRFVSFRLSDMNNEFAVVGKIIGAVWSCPMYTSTITQKTMICDFLKVMFPSRCASYLESEVFPIIAVALGLTWDFPWDLYVSHASDFLSTESKFDAEPVLASSVLASLTRYVLALSKTVAIMLDNTHYLSSASWAVLTKLCSSRCNTVFVMSINVRKVYDADNLDYQDHAAAMAEKSISEYFSQSNETLHYCDLLLGKSMVAVSDHPEYYRFCEIMGRLHLREILLMPLSSNDIAMLITRELCASSSAASHEAVSKIEFVSQGNPFLLWKIIEYAKESNLRDIDTLASSIHDNSFIIFMMNKLSQKQRMILKAASIVGDSFNISILEEILPSDDKLSVPNACAKLVRRGLLVELSHDTFGFGSPLIRKFVYDLVPHSDRSQMHGLIADAVAFQHRGDLKCQMYSLSYHYSLSDVEHHKALAFKCSCSAAENLFQRQSFEVILQYLEAAWASAVSRRERWRLYRILCRTTDAVTRKLSLESDGPSAALLNVILRNLCAIKKSVREGCFLFLFPSMLRRSSTVGIERTNEF